MVSGLALVGLSAGSWVHGALAKAEVGLDQMRPWNCEPLKKFSRSLPFGKEAKTSAWGWELRPWFENRSWGCGNRAKSLIFAASVVLS
ncbi:unnamed protein product [Prunus armeniaca]